MTGFPPDVKPREIHNLFRPFQGYEDSILKPNGTAFATFTSHEAALIAKQEVAVHAAAGPCCCLLSLLLLCRLFVGSAPPELNSRTASRSPPHQQGLHFDPDSTEVLKVDFAKQNSKRRRDAEESASPECTSLPRSLAPHHHIFPHFSSSSHFHSLVQRKGSEAFEEGGSRECNES